MERHNIGEMLDHAIAIEEMGQKFYAILAEKQNNPQLQKIFTLMARQEVGHREMYRKMREQLTVESIAESAPAEPFDEKKHALLEDKIFNRMEIVRKSFSVYSLVDTLTLMIEIEINVVDYFENIRRLIRHQDQPLMQRMINEEKMHVKQLIDLRTQIKAGPRK